PGAVWSPRTRHLYRAELSKRKITRFVALALEIKVGAPQRRFHQELRQRSPPRRLSLPLVDGNDNGARPAVARDRLWRGLRAVDYLGKLRFGAGDGPALIVIR